MLGAVKLPPIEIFEYYSADPFPHLVVPDMWNPELLRRAERELAVLPLDKLMHIEHLHTDKYASRPLQTLPPACSKILRTGNGWRTRHWLQKLVGFKLLVDPTLTGGGIHIHEPGGFLDIHTDFKQHPTTGYNRRVNMITFLNKGWRAAWEGDLELWDKRFSIKKSVLPEFNVTVIFNTVHAKTFHGVPKPLRCPDGVRRKSLAWYYYTESDILSRKPAGILVL